MKIVKLLKIEVFLLIIGLMACKPNVSKIYIDKNIPKDIQSEIQKQNEKLFKVLKENDKQKIKELLAPKLLETSGEKLDSLMNILSNDLKKTTSFTIKKDFYIANSTKDISNTVVSGISGDYDFSINYLALNKDIYISLIIPDTEPDQLLITCIYGKYNDEWKINILRLDLYSLQKKNAIDFYKQAQELYSKGYLIDAANTMFIGSQCLKPAGQYMKYHLEAKILEFTKSIQTELQQKYILPKELNAIQSKPLIVNIVPKRLDKGYFPMIEYVTKVSIKDTLNLRRENDEIHKIIGSIYKGIDKEKEYLLYRAWSKIPNGKTKTDVYGFVKKLQ